MVIKAYKDPPDQGSHNASPVMLASVATPTTDVEVGLLHGALLASGRRRLSGPLLGASEKDPFEEDNETLVAGSLSGRQWCGRRGIAGGVAGSGNLDHGYEDTGAGLPHSLDGEATSVIEALSSVHPRRLSSQQSDSDTSGSDFSETQCQLMQTARLVTKAGKVPVLLPKSQEIPTQHQPMMPPLSNSDGDEDIDNASPSMQTRADRDDVQTARLMTKAGKAPVLLPKSQDIPLSPAKGRPGRPSRVHLDEAASLKTNVANLVASSAQKVGVTEPVMRRLAGLDGPARHRETNLWNLYLQVRAQSDSSSRTGQFNVLFFCGVLMVYPTFTDAEAWLQRMKDDYHEMTSDLDREEIAQFRENLEAKLNGLTKDPVKTQLAMFRLRMAKKRLNRTVGCDAVSLIMHTNFAFR